MARASYDIAIIGGGILGAATAMQLAQRYPASRIVLLEKEAQLAAHQSGHNSGVIHSGIYYKPGSLKARNCVEGARQLLSFCEANGIGYELCGKLIVATSEDEIPRLEKLYRRGKANLVPGLEMVDAAKLREIEPHAAGLRGIWSPHTGIIDYVAVTRAYAARFQEHGGEVRLGARVLAIRQKPDASYLITEGHEIQARHVINCAGLQADLVAKMAGARPGSRIVPFRGEYFLLRPEAHHLVRGLIYPVPDPELPFLGVHFTRRIQGGVEAGPNAILATAREGYTKTRLNPHELALSLGYGGFWAMARRYWRTGLSEVHRSFSKAAFVRSLQRLVPEVQASDLIPGSAGVRAQAVDADGSLADDFRIVASARAVHVLNAPSPGATASLAIANDIVTMAGEAFDLK